MADRPNLVFVFADQMRARATGYAGDPNVLTPHLDRLHGESVSFDTAVSNCPICTPYRASLLTGQYPLTTGLFMNDLCLGTDAPSIAHVFGEAGYDTAYIGKWHVDGHGRCSYIPPERRQGFDCWKVLECTHNYNHSQYYEGDSDEPRVWDGYDTLAQSRDAAAYLRDRADAERPFILFVSYGTPHNPYPTAPEAYRSLYDPERLVLPPNVDASCEAEARRDLAGYYAHTSALDDGVGMIRQALTETGLAENTVFVFTSDHGDSVWSQCTAESGLFNKQRPFDESVLVPFLLHWPAGLGPGHRSVAAPVATPDIMPTLLELCGLSIPSSVEGISYAEALVIGSEPERDAVLIAGYSPFSDWRPQRGGREYRGVRSQRYTYVRDLGGPWLLFDNYEDPFQLDNLVNRPEHAVIQAELEAGLARILKEQGDAFEPADALRARFGYQVDPRSMCIPYGP